MRRRREEEERKGRQEPRWQLPEREGGEVILPDEGRQGDYIRT